MRMAPTLNGGLRIDAEEPHDWQVLRCIAIDANPLALASWLSLSAGEDAEDWEELVQPDLEAGFEDQIDTVSAAIHAAALAASEGPGSLFIEKADGEKWFGALNQARLALHSKYDFSDEEADVDEMDFDKRSAFFRYQFYMVIQDVLLNRIMQ